MYIYLAQPIEPYSEVTLGPPEEDRQQAQVAASDTARLLKTELLRYCKGEINGRSFLIAAHRGGGKTTLVRSVVQQVAKLSEEAYFRIREGKPDKPLLRPLLVSLHGPDLIPEIAKAASESWRRPGKQAVSAAAKPSDNQAENMLKQVVLRLHRALSMELGRHYADRVSELVATGRTPSSDLYERSAEFSSELFMLRECPDAAALRRFWAAAQALGEKRGVTPVARLPWQRGVPGLCELQALSGVMEAYKRLSGHNERQHHAARDDTYSETHESASKLAPSDIVAALLALAGGGLAATAAVGANAGTPTSILLGALVAAITFKFGSKRERAQREQNNGLFDQDVTFLSVKRILPVMFNWLREAGYAPVVMVDELDKIDGNSASKLFDDKNPVVKELKDIVTERAIFCFLVDRTQFEQIKEDVQAHPTGSLSSFFTRRSLHAIKPSDWNNYLLGNGQPGTGILELREE